MKVAISCIQRDESMSKRLIFRFKRLSVKDSLEENLYVPTLRMIRYRLAIEGPKYGFSFVQIPYRLTMEGRNTALRIHWVSLMAVATNFTYHLGYQGREFDPKCDGSFNVFPDVITHAILYFESI